MPTQNLAIMFTDIKDNDVLGEAVNIAARLEGVTEAGEVYFTDAVLQTMNRSEAPSADVGEKLFKGIPHPVRVYRVVHEPGSDLATRLANGVRMSERGPVLAGIRETMHRRTLKRNAVIAAAVAAVAAVGTTAVLMRPAPPAGFSPLIAEAQAAVATARSDPEQQDQYYPQQSVDWAGEALAGGNVLAFQNAWLMLENANDARLQQPHLQALSFVQELVQSFPKFLNSGDVRDALVRLRLELEQAWGLAHADASGQGT